MGNQIKLHSDCVDICSELILEQNSDSVHFNDTQSCKDVASHLIRSSLPNQPLTSEMEDFIKVFFYVKEAEACFAYDPRDELKR